MPARFWAALTNPVSALVNGRFFKPVVWVFCLTPGVILAVKLFRFLTGHEDALGVDPNVTLLHETGKTALIFLVASLSVTPVRRIFKINRVQIVRRLLGVTSFFYALAHISMYLVFDQLCYSLATCDFHNTWVDILKRKFIFAGMLTFSVLTVLAATSTSGWVRRLKKRWVTLHRLVYVAGIAAVVHYVWGQKSDIGEPLRWGAYVAILLGIRVYFAWQKRQGQATTQAARVSG